MKKLTALLLACMTFVCAAVSCGDKENDKDKSDKKAETTTVAEDDKADEKKSDDEKSDDAEKKDGEKKAEDDKDDDSSESVKADDSGAESVAVPAEAEELAKKFAEATIKSDIKVMLSCLYPKAVVDKMNESGDADDFSDAVGDPGENGNLLSVSVSDGKKLSKDAADGAKKYYDIYAKMLGADAEYKIVDGYSMKLAMQVEDDGEKEDMDEEIIAVKLDGEDWLLVPMGEDELVDLVSEEIETESAAAETTTEKATEKATD